MKNFLLATAALAALLATPAVAQTAGAMTQQHFDTLDKDRDGTITKAEYDAFMANAFGQLDRNRDGRLSPAETAGVLSQEQFTVLDTNGDGRVTRAEFATQVSKDFAQSDRNRDGGLN